MRSFPSPILDKTRSRLATRFLAGLVILLIWNAPTARAEFTFDDIHFWVDHSSAANATTLSSSVLVMDWNDGRGALAWGFRWDSTVTGLSQGDVLTTISLADPRFSYAAAGGFLESFTYDPGDGSGVRFASNIFTPGDNQGVNWFVHSNLVINDAEDGFKEPHELTGTPWAQGNDPRDFLLLTPVGFLGIPVVHDSWTYWAFSYWSENSGYAPSNVPWTQPIAVIAIPEPGKSSLIIMGCTLVLLRRRKRAISRHA